MSDEPTREETAQSNEQNVEAARIEAENQTAAGEAQRQPVQRPTNTEHAVQQEQIASMQRPPDQTETPEGMTRVHVMNNFTLNRGPGGYETFTKTGTNCGLPGYYDMTPEDAEHWFVQAHSENPPEPLPPMAGSQAAAEVVTTQLRRRQLHDNAIEQEAHLAQENVRRGKQKRIKEQMGESFEQAP